MDRRRRLPSRIERVLLFAGLCHLAGAALAVPPWNEAAAQKIDATLTRLVQENHVAGMAFGIVIDDELVFASGYGLRKLGENDRITERSVFHWASVSKPFVAIAILQLVEKKELSLDDRLAAVLPYFRMADERYRNITIRQLLTHTSGMPDVEDYEWDRPQFDDGALKRWAMQQSDAVLLFSPGSSREYSNLGYELLGLVVQEVSGVAFEQYMKEAIFEPLGMNDSSFVANEIRRDLRTTGHLGEPERTVAEYYPYNRRHAPSSTLNTNVVDMSHFAVAMLHHGSRNGRSILAEGTLAAMWTPAWTDPDDPTRQSGLGWNIGRRWGGLLTFAHGGHDDGFRSYLAIAPEENAAVFVASNDDNAPIGPFLISVLTILLPEYAEAAANSD